MDYKSPKLTVDGIIIKDDSLLLIKRKNDPFKDCWALPGGFVDYNETTEDAVIREIKEETGLVTEIKNIIGVFSDPKRDPRGHTVSIVYLLNIKSGDIVSGDDAADARFFNFDCLPNLAFDHDKIVSNIINRRN